MEIVADLNLGKMPRFSENYAAKRMYQRRFCARLFHRPHRCDIERSGAVEIMTFCLNPLEKLCP